MKEEALKLADKLDGLNSCEPVIIKACEDMIRKLVAEVERLQGADALIKMWTNSQWFKDAMEKKRPCTCGHSIGHPLYSKCVCNLTNFIDT